MLKLVSKYVLFSLMFLGSSSFQTKHYVREFLAFSFNPGPNMEVVTYAIVTTQGGKIVKSEFINKQSFIDKATGKELTKANPYQINLFEAFGIDECFYTNTETNNTISNQKSAQKKCTTINDLWRLRYKTHPQYKINFFSGDETIFGGWIKDEKLPSLGQLDILQGYGIIQLTDFFYGENMFLLFKDMQTPSWVEKYKAS